MDTENSLNREKFMNRFSTTDETDSANGSNTRREWPVHGLEEERKFVVKETKEKPEKYWKHLGCFLLAALGVIAIQAVIYVSNSAGESTSADMLRFINFVLPVIPLWAFIGWELDDLKSGLIAGGIAFITAILIWLIPYVNIPFIGYIPFVAGIAYFGYTTLSDKNRLGKFILLALVLMIGKGAMTYYPQLDFSRDVSQILRHVFGVSNDLGTGFISWEIEMEDGWSHFVSLDWVFGSFFAYVLTFLGVTYIHRYLEGKQVWSFRRVFPGRNITSKSMALYVLAFYGGTVMLSLGIMGQTISFFEWVWRPSWGYEAVTGDYVRHAVSFCCSLALLPFVVGLYRKILLEYYLENEKSIGWNFYFGQMPVIGFFVWWNNLVSFRKPYSGNLEKLRKMDTGNQGLTSFLVAIAILYLILVLVLISMVGRINLLPFAAIILGVVLYFFYLYNESGIYVLIAFRMIAFLIIIVMQMNDANIPENLLSRGLFWSLAQSFLVYPAFHLKMFTAEVFVPNHPAENEHADVLDVPVT